MDLIKTAMALKMLKPELTGTVTPGEIIKLFSNGPWTLSPNFHFKFHDARYSTIRPESLGKFLRYCYVDDMDYKKQAFDCDNFAGLTAALSSYWIGSHAKKANSRDSSRVYAGSFMGTCVVPGHMVNYAIVRIDDAEPIILFVEPQSDRVISSDVVATWKIKNITQS